MSTALENEIDNLLSGNSIYTANQQSWQYSLESYMGGELYRNAGHLQRYQMESAGEYQQRLNTTPLDNHCQGVVSVYMSFLFREQPERTFNSIDNSPELESFLKDADHDGRSLNSFMKDVATWSSVFGHAWIVMAKPDIGALTRADEIAQGVRPYVNILTPLAVLDWSWKRLPSGKYVLDYFKYLEDINGSVRVVKEWTNETIVTSQVDVDLKTINTTVELNGLGKIPAVCAYNGRSMIRGVGVGDIDDIRDAQKFIYNMTTEIQQSAVLDSHPSLVVTPDTQIGTGAGAIIQIAENSDPGLKPYLLEYSGASIDSMLASISATIDSIDKMANIGSIRSTESRRMSGVAQQQEFELLNARLAEKSDQMELAEEGIWRLYCDYQGYRYDVEVEYPGSFNIRDEANEFQQLQTAKSTATSQLVLGVIDRKLLEMLGEDPEDYTLGSESA